MRIRQILWLWMVGVGLMVGPQARGSESMLLDGSAAHVNERTVTIGEVMSAIQPVRRQLMQSHSGDELREKLMRVYEDALQSLIDRYLILDEYKNQRRQIPEWAIDQRVNEIIHSSFGGDRSALLTALSAEYLSFEAWRDQIRDQLIVMTMRQLYVDENVAVSPQAVRQAYDENRDQFKIPPKVRLRMIVFSKDGPTDRLAAKRHLAEDIRVQAVSGADFAGLARKYSEGAKAEEGGDWGWVLLEDLRPELARPLAELKTSDVSEVIETEKEFYLVKVEGRRSDTYAPFESVQPELEKKLRQKESESLYKAWTQRLRMQAYVKVFDLNLF